MVVYYAPKDNYHGDVSIFEREISSNLNLTVDEIRWYRLRRINSFQAELLRSPAAPRLRLRQTTLSEFRNDENNDDDTTQRGAPLFFPTT